MISKLSVKCVSCGTGVHLEIILHMQIRKSDMWSLNFFIGSDVFDDDDVKGYVGRKVDGVTSQYDWWNKKKKAAHEKVTELFLKLYSIHRSLKNTCIKLTTTAPPLSPLYSPRISPRETTWKKKYQILSSEAIFISTKSYSCHDNNIGESIIGNGIEYPRPSVHMGGYLLGFQIQVQKRSTLQYFGWILLQNLYQTKINHYRIISKMRKAGARCRMGLYTQYPNLVSLFMDHADDDVIRLHYLFSTVTWAGHLLSSPLPQVNTSL